MSEPEHDLLCNWEWFYHPGGRSVSRCTCDLIARVRADERRMQVEADPSIAKPLRSLIAQQVDADPEFLTGLESEWRRMVAEEIARGIEEDALDEWTLGRSWIDVCAGIARQIGDVK